MQEMEGNDPDDMPEYVQEVMEDIEHRPQNIDMDAEMDAIIEDVRAGNPPLEERSELNILFQRSLVEDWSCSALLQHISHSRTSL